MPQNNVLRVSVEGPAGSGKSGIGLVIARALQAEGIQVTFTDPEMSAMSIDTNGRGLAVITSLRTRDTLVVIEEKQTKRIHQPIPGVFRGTQ